MSIMTRMVGIVGAPMIFLMIIPGIFSFEEARCFPFVNARVAESTTETLTTTDIEIIVAAAHYWTKDAPTQRGKSNAKFLAVQMEAAAGESKQSFFLPNEFVGNLTTGTLQYNTVKRNHHAFALPRPVTIGDVVIAGSKTFEGWWNKGTLEKEIPDMNQSFSMWLPGYSSDGEEALLYMFYSGSDGYRMDAAGYILYLKHTAGRWEVVRSRECWRT